MNLNKIDVKLQFLMENGDIEDFKVLVIAYHLSHRYREELLLLGVDIYAGEYVHAYPAILSKKIIEILSEKSYVNRIVLDIEDEK